MFLVLQPVNLVLSDRAILMKQVIPRDWLEAIAHHKSLYTSITPEIALHANLSSADDSARIATYCDTRNDAP